MKPNIFHVEAGGEFRPVEITFANETEVRRVRGWRKLPGATDAGEFATLAAKRWFYYSREGASVASLAELRAAIRRNDRAELAFLLVASAAWAKPDQFLALAFCRRTWCHHLGLDFLAVRPGLKFAGQPISGVGSGVLFSLTGLAEALGMEMIWGEATASSASFYEKVLQIRPMQDLFIIRREMMRDVAQRYFARQKHRLARAGEKAQVSAA